MEKIDEIIAENLAICTLCEIFRWHTLLRLNRKKIDKSHRLYLLCSKNELNPFAILVYFRHI